MLLAPHLHSALMSGSTSSAYPVDSSAIVDDEEMDEHEHEGQHPRTRKSFRPWEDAGVGGDAFAGLSMGHPEVLPPAPAHSTSTAPAPASNPSSNAALYSTIASRFRALIPSSTSSSTSPEAIYGAPGSARRRAVLAEFKDLLDSIPDRAVRDEVLAQWRVLLGEPADAEARRRRQKRKRDGGSGAGAEGGSESGASSAASSRRSSASSEGRVSGFLGLRGGGAGGGGMAMTPLSPPAPKAVEREPAVVGGMAREAEGVLRGRSGGGGDEDGDGWAAPTSGAAGGRVRESNVRSGGS